MRKILILALLTFLQHNSQAQLITRYALGVSGIIERGIRTPKAIHASTPMVYGGSILVLTEDKKERVFFTLGVGLTNYVRNDLSVAPSEPDPMSSVQSLPKSSRREEYDIAHINFPVSFGYKFIRGKRLGLYGSVGLESRFKVSSKLAYTVKDSTQKVIFERTTTDLPYLERLLLFAVAAGIEYKSSSKRFIYRIEPFLKLDSRKLYQRKNNSSNLNEFLYYSGLQLSCFYQFNLKSEK